MAVGRVRVSSLALLMQLVSALLPCAPASDGRVAVAFSGVDGKRSILVSTIDGALTALDVDGGTLWTVASAKGPLFSSTFSYSKVSPQLVPGLDRLLYELDGDVLQQLPVTVDTMMEGALPCRVQFWRALGRGLFRVWMCTQGRRLKTFQMRCLQDILGLTLLYMHQNVDILKEMGQLPVEEQLRQKQLQWLGHVQRMPDHRPQKQLLWCRPQGKRRRPGGTLLRWIDVISRDLVGVTNWQELLYTCDTSQCVQYSDALSAVPSTNALKVTLDRVQVRGASASTGTEQWNFTVGRLHLSLSRDSGDEPTEDVELGLRLRVDAVGGVVTALHKHSGEQVWSKQFSSPVVDLWSVDSGRLRRVIPRPDSSHIPMPSTVLLGSYNGQLYVQPIHPSPRAASQALGGTSQSVKASPSTFSSQSMCGGWGQGPYPGAGAAVSQLLLPTNSPPGVGAYFCAASPNASWSLVGHSLQPSEAGLEDALCITGSEGELHCAAAPCGAAEYPTVWMLLTVLTSPVLMAIVIVVLVALVVRSRRKRKILEHDILELRQQSSSVPLTPSTPLVDLEPVPAELVGDPWRDTLGGEGVVRKNSSKSESSEDSVHPCESDSRFCSDFMPSELLGSGAFGVVFRCQNRVDGSDYAVKRIKLPCKESAREKVMREAKALAQLDHPGIVRYYGAWVEKGRVEDPEWEGLFSAGMGTEEHSWASTAGGPSSTHQDSPHPHMEAIDGASLPSVSSHSSFVEFRDSSESHGNQVEGTPANTSGVEFLIMQDSNDIVLPSKAISNPEPRRDGGCAGVVLPSAQLFIQMQLCRKESLRDWLRTNVETRSRKTVLLYFEQILDAVCYVHYKGMMHRDLKPSNIFFSFDGCIKIGDFGLVAGDFDSFPSSASFSSRRTLLDLASLNQKGRTGNVGTHLYISPEQVTGIDYNQKVDIYSLGVIFYEMNHAFPTEMERTKVLEGLRSDRFPAAFKEALPGELEMVRWMLSPDPAHRPSAEQVASSTRLAELKCSVQATHLDPLPRL